MPKSENQKQKLLYLVKLLRERSDEKHPLPMADIILALEQEGIKAERKSIYTDMEALRDFGYDIILQKGKNGGYYLGSREFETAELKLLVDAVSASRFITKKKSRELISKLSSMASNHDAGELKREVYVVNRIKSENEGILYNIDAIHDAIQKNCRITYRYLEYTLNKEEHFRRGGKLYEVSPVALTWSDENYYLIAFDEEADSLKHYRVDKIKGIALSKKKRSTKLKEKDFKLADYCNKTFGMFAGRDEVLKINLPNSLVGVIIDRFGKDVTIHKENEDTFTARISVKVSNQFFGWLTGLGPEVRLISPEHVVEEYKEYLARIQNRYH